MSWPAHPDDEWVEITSFGDSEPKFILGKSGTATEIERARAAYLADQITIEEFEQRITAAIEER